MNGISKDLENVTVSNNKEVENSNKNEIDDNAQGKTTAEGEEVVKKKKKKNKSKNKSSGGTGSSGTGIKCQTDPPSIPISELYPSGITKNQNRDKKFIKSIFRM